MLSENELLNLGLHTPASGSVAESDRIKYLAAMRVMEETGQWKGLFTYPNCPADCVVLGLIDGRGKVSAAGRAALQEAEDD